MQEEELDPLFLGVTQLLDASRRLGFGPAIDAAHRRNAETLGNPQAVHRGVASADDDDAGAEADRRAEIGEAVAAHQVYTRQELIGRIDLAGILAGDAEEARRAGASGDEHGVIA